MFSTILVANRGEIALRVMRTCRRLGIRTVAVHTDLDAVAPHVRAADAAVRVDSYLDIEQVVAAAVATGAEAVHPGYGFLSERAAFAEAVAKAGLVLVGPSAEVMEQMGRKDAAREIAEQAGVPVVPRFDAAGGETVGFPVLVKAASGGGGKGMRIVHAEADLPDAVAAAAREAATAFGDDTLLIEKLVEHGRHIEVQILADQHGTVLHLFERDCSAQRRHQKVIEEAPAPGIDTDLRDRITTAAVDLARAVGYTNAGTVEFLLDVASGEFYFLEMNTRLQVEHPVTEAIAGGIDLVEHQLRIAAGEPLAFGQDDLVIVGHAMEARVYAEDAFNGFLPQAGTASSVHWPREARVDQALESGQVVSTAYDPMLGKVIVHGTDREDARKRLVAALGDTAILGLTTNVGFLRALASTDEFRDGRVETAWLDDAEIPVPSVDEARAVAAWCEVKAEADAFTGPWRSDGWRSAGPARAARVRLDRVVEVDRATGVADGRAIQEFGVLDGLLALSLDGERVGVACAVGSAEVEVVLRGQRHVFRRPDATDHQLESGGAIGSPMPGAVVEVRVAVGDTVEAGDVLGTVEAMKMEHALRAPFAGTVTQVGAATGAQVALGDLLFTVEELFASDRGTRERVGEHPREADSGSRHRSRGGS